MASFLYDDNIAEHRKFLYRIRVGDGIGFSRSDLFHIPFEHREKIKTQRFSIPGFPCLYLGGSVYVCWEEMGRPDLNSVHVAQFCPVHGATLRVVNLGYRPQFLVKHLDIDPEVMEDPQACDIIRSNIALWPLTVSCHVKVKHKGGDFKPEYIVPQIVLQWVRRSDQFEGVCYSSTHIDQTFNRPFAQMNFAFPAREIRSRGHCPRLLAEFELSQPLSWQLASVVDSSFWRNEATPAEEISPQSDGDFPYTDFLFGVATDVSCRYANTGFYDMQFKLWRLKRESLPVE